MKNRKYYAKFLLIGAVALACYLTYSWFSRRIVIRRVKRSHIRFIPRLVDTTILDHNHTFSSSKTVALHRQNNLSDWHKNFLADAHQNSNFVLLGAYQQDMLVGFILIDCSNTQKPELKQLFVLPSWQRRGIGSTLLVRALEATELKTPAARRLIVELIKGNERAARFYTKHGFSHDHDYQENDYLVTVLTKKLAQQLSAQDEQ